MTERWRTCARHSGYEVSDQGRVRSLDRIIADVAGRHRQWRGKVLSPGPKASGHLTVVLGDVGTVMVHTLVLEAFTGPCPPGMECRHLDGDEKNNDWTNLKWDSPVRNQQDIKWHKGKRGQPLRPQDVRAIKAALAIGKHGIGSALARRYGVSKGAISHIKVGLTHKDV